VASGGLTDRSGSITTGGTAQNAAAANTGRQYLIIQNISSEVMWVSVVGTAAASTAGSFRLAADGGYIEWYGDRVPTGAVSVVAATTGSKFTCLEG
jgi:hypothetical protein